MLQQPMRSKTCEITSYCKIGSLACGCYFGDDQRAHLRNVQVSLQTTGVGILVFRLLKTYKPYFIRLKFKVYDMICSINQKLIARGQMMQP